MKKKIVMLDLIRIINVLNISLLIGIFLSRLGINRYVVFVLMLLGCAILSHCTQKTFVKRYGSENTVSGNIIFIIISICINILLIIYYILEMEYMLVTLLLIFFLCQFFFSKRKAQQRKQLKWRIEHV